MNKEAMEIFSCLNKEALILLSKHNLLQLLIEKEIFHTKFIDFPLDEQKEIKELKDLIFRQNNIKDDEEFENWLKRSNTSTEDLYRKYINNVKLERYCENEYGHMTESMFLKNKEKYDSVTYRLIRLKDRGLANELYFQLKEGEIDFSSAANKFSEGEEKSSNGLVGPTPLSSAHPVLKDLLRNSSPNELNEPIKIVDWWIIVVLQSLNEAVFDSEMKTRLSKEVFQESLSKEATELIKSLKTRHQIQDKNE